MTQDTKELLRKLEEKADRKLHDVGPDVELRVSGSTTVVSLATAIAGHVAAGKRVSLLAIGVPAVNQAVKAAASANGPAAQHGYFLTLYPSFTMVQVQEPDGRMVEKTAMRLLLCKHLPGM